MNYRIIKEKRDKLHKEIEGLKRLELKFEDSKIVKEKITQYQFYNNLLKAFR